MRFGAMCLGLVCAVAAWGCDGDPPADPCADRLTLLQERLVQRQSVRDPEGAPPDVPLPVIDGSVPAPNLPLLVVSEREVRFAERGAGGLSTLEATTGALLQDLRLHLDFEGGDEPVEVGLWVDPAVTLETLHRLLGHAPPRVRFVLLARGPFTPAGSMPAWLTAELARIDPPSEGEGEGFPGVSVVTPEAQRRSRLPAAWARATRGCEGVEHTLPFDARGTLARASVSALVDGVQACGCDGTDVNAIEAVALEALRSGDGPLVRLPPTMRFGPGNAVELELPGSTTVVALTRQLAERPAGLLFVRVE